MAERGYKIIDQQGTYFISISLAGVLIRHLAKAMLEVYFY